MPMATVTSEGHVTASSAVTSSSRGNTVPEPHPQEPSLSWLQWLGVFAAVTFFSWLGVSLTKHSEGVATIWFSNGIVFALVIRQPKSRWPLIFALELLADILGDRIYGDPMLTNIAVSLCNAGEVFLTAALLTRWFGLPVNLTRTRQLLAFLATGVLGVPMLSCAASVACLALYQHTAWAWTDWRTWYLGDMLGMAIIAPLVYLIQEPNFFSILRPKQLPPTLAVLSVPALCTVIDFWQQKEVAAFFMLPSLLFVVFRLGLRGAVLGVLVIAAICLPLTLIGHGPLSIVPNIAMLHRIVIVQLMIAVALLTAFPVATLLEENRTVRHSLQLSEARFRTLANTDALTGQANRRAFNERLDEEWHKGITAGTLLAVLALDVDFFKKYNDIYGHIAGDDCLRRIAMAAADTLHQNTTACLYRLGGEEFAVLLAPGDAYEAFQLAEQIRLAILTQAIVHSESPLGIQTISIGVAAILPEPAQKPLSLLERADQALYRAKLNGRNRTESLS